MDKELQGYIGFRAPYLGFEDAHCTLLYTGPLTNEQRGFAYAILEPHVTKIAHGIRKGISLFGPNNDIPVINLEFDLETFTSLMLIRTQLINAGIPNPSSFKEWNPHITLNNDALVWEIPKVILLDQMAVR